MVRRLDRLSPTPVPWFLPSRSTAWIALMLDLLGIERPLREGPAISSALDWSELIGQTFGWVMLRRMEGTPEQQRSHLAEELKAGRPVGLWLKEMEGDSPVPVEQGWIALRMNEICHYIFIDAVRQHPESVQTAGQFTERRVIRFDLLAPGSVLAMLYWHSLVAPVPFRLRGRPRKRAA